MFPTRTVSAAACPSPDREREPAMSAPQRVPKRGHGCMSKEVGTSLNTDTCNNCRSSTERAACFQLMTSSNGSTYLIVPMNVAH